MSTACVLKMAALVVVVKVTDFGAGRARPNVLPDVSEECAIRQMVIVTKDVLRGFGVTGVK